MGSAMSDERFVGRLFAANAIVSKTFEWINLSATASARHWSQCSIIGGGIDTVLVALPLTFTQELEAC